MCRPAQEQAVQLQLATVVARLAALVPGKLQGSSACKELRQNLLHLLRRLCQGVGGPGPAVLQRIGSDGARKDGSEALLVSSISASCHPAVLNASSIA